MTADIPYVHLVAAQECAQQEQIEELHEARQTARFARRAIMALPLLAPAARVAACYELCLPREGLSA